MPTPSTAAEPAPTQAFALDPLRDTPTVRSAADRDPDPLAAAVVPGEFGHYRIVRKLGAGGMSVVYLAEDTRLRRSVALKVMRPDVSVDPLSRDRFVREARAVAAITHDNVISVYEVGQIGPVPYIAVQFLKGTTLADWQRAGRAIPVGQAVRIARETAAGLAAAHARGLVHRDVKPANLWLEAPNGRVKVLDFGLAREAGGDTRLTAAGMVVGTPAYMAPEQARGHAVDARTDLFSLGVVLFEMLTNRLPFQADGPLGMLTALMVDDPPAVRDLNPRVPAELSDLVARLLAKFPDDRPDSAAAVTDALQAIERRLKRDDTGPTAVAPTVAVAPTPAAALRPVVVGEKTSVARKTVRRQPDDAPPTRTALWAAAGGAGVAAAVLLWLMLPAGTGSVELTSPDSMAMVLIEQDGKRVGQLSPASGRLELPTGTYTARSMAPLPFVQVTTDQGGPTFTLNRAQVVRVRVTLLTMMTPPGGGQPPPGMSPGGLPFPPFPPPTRR